MRYLLFCVFLLKTSFALSQIANQVLGVSLSSNYLVDVNNVDQQLKFLSSDLLEGRKSGTEGGNKAAAYLSEFLNQIDVKPYFKTHFDTLQNFKPITYNVLGFIEGNDLKLKNEFVVFGAHYDHIGTENKNKHGDIINNGANDNASGVVAAMEIARYFSETKSNKRSVLIAFFAAEEDGLKGSREMAKQLKNKKINLYTALMFEMIGVPMKAPHSSYITGFKKSNFAEKINDYSGKKLVGYLPMEFQYQLFFRSDNFPFFLEFDIPAHAISTFDFNNFEYYHNVKDEFELMDTKHMAALIQDYLKVAQGLTNSPAKEVVLKK